MLTDKLPILLMEGGRTGPPHRQQPSVPWIIWLHKRMPEGVTPLPLPGKVGGFIANKKTREGGFTANPPSQK